MDNVNESLWRCSTLTRKAALKKRTKSGVSVYYGQAETPGIVRLAKPCPNRRERSRTQETSRRRRERKSKRAIIELKYQPKGAVIKPSSLAHKVNQRLIN